MPVNNYYDTRDQKSGEIVFPFGPATVETLAFAAAIELAPFNTKSYYTIGTLTGALALTVVPVEGTFVGSELTVEATADGTGRTITLGAGFEWDEATYAGGAVALGINKTAKLFFEYDGKAFVLKDVVGIN